MNRSVDRYLKLLFGVFFFARLCCNLFAAEGPSLAEILSRMEKADESSGAVRFNFTQKITFTLTGETQTRRGEMIFKKPDHIRIDQKKPAEQLMVSDGKTIRVYTPSYAQVVVDKWSNWRKNNELAYTFLSITKSFVQFESQYNFNYVSKSERGFELTLKPKKSGLPEMRLVVDVSSYMPVRTEVILDSAVIASDIEGLEVNPPIDSDAFKLSVPKKTKIIDLK